MAKSVLDETCPRCMGAGIVRCSCKGSGKVMCSLCNGTSMITLHSNCQGRIVSVSTPCTNCNEGYVPCPGHDVWGRTACDVCSGVGIVSIG